MGIAWDGSVANKMAAALISQLAQCCKKPAYIASELHTAKGHPIILERRIPDEIVSPDDFDSMDGINVINQFFDLTPCPPDHRPHHRARRDRAGHCFTQPGPP